MGSTGGIVANCTLFNNFIGCLVRFVCNETSSILVFYLSKYVPVVGQSRHIFSVLNHLTNDSAGVQITILVAHLCIIIGKQSLVLRLIELNQMIQPMFSTNCLIKLLYQKEYN